MQSIKYYRLAARRPMRILEDDEQKVAPFVREPLSLPHRTKTTDEAIHKQITTTTIDHGRSRTDTSTTIL